MESWLFYNSTIPRLNITIFFNVPMPTSILIGNLMIVLIYSLGLIFNVVIMGMIITVDKIKNAADVLILHLAICDIFISVAFLVYCGVVYSTYHLGWPASIMDVVCKLITFVMLLSLSLHIYTLTWIALERYRVIIHPTKPQLKGKNMVIILISMWFFLAIVPALGIPGTAASRFLKYLCYHHVQGQRYSIVLASLYFLVIGYIIPTIIMFYCYARIIKKLRQVSWMIKKRVTEQNQGQKHKERVIKTLIVVSALFVITGLPLVIGLARSIYVDSTASTLTVQQYASISFINYFIGFFLHISPIYNPIIYLIKKKIGFSSLRCPPS